MSYLSVCLFYCYKQDAVLSYIAVSIQAVIGGRWNKYE